MTQRGHSAIEMAAERLEESSRPPVTTPRCDLLGFLSDHARVRLRDGSYAPFSFDGRRPLVRIAELLDGIVRNTVHGQAVEIDGVTFRPGQLKGATVAVCGGAQFGKTVLELNLGGYVTTIEFLNFGYYTSDRELLATIVDTKFRPDVVDQIPWMAAMIQLNKTESRSGRTVDRKNAFQVTDGSRKAFGYFNGMQKPPTTISLDVAVLDEVDDIPERNIGFVAGRMTNSNVQLTCFIGTQRTHAAGQNSRWKAGSMHRWLCVCPKCGREICLEEHWPGVCRVALDGAPRPADPKLSETMAYDPEALYYAACPDCGAALDRDKGRYVPERPERVRGKVFSFRVSQMAIPAIEWRDIAASWFAALADPNPEAMTAWHCDRRAIPHAGAAQPLGPAALSRARACGLADEPGEPNGKGYAMSLAAPGGRRVAGLDTGPRCWLWANDARGALVSALAWAEMIPSGTAFSRLMQLHAAGAFECLFIDAGGEPDLTKRLVLALNGLENYAPPAVALDELRRMTLQPRPGLVWDGNRGAWRGIKAAAVAFSLREAGGVQQDVGFTQDGRIYPLIKCNRAESLQGFVNDFLTPAEGVVQHVSNGPESAPVLRTLPRQRLPASCIGPGVTDTLLDAHLMNLRRVRDARTNREDWADGVENHLGLAGCYARLAAVVGTDGGGAHAAVSGVAVRNRMGRAAAGGRREVLA